MRSSRRSLAAGRQARVSVASPIRVLSMRVVLLMSRFKGNSKPVLWGMAFQASIHGDADYDFCRTYTSYGLSETHAIDRVTRKVVKKRNKGKVSPFTT